MTRIAELLPTLQITAKEGTDGLTMRDLDIKLDGVDVKGLRGLTLHLTEDDITEATLEIGIQGLEVDSKVMQWLEAEAKEGADAED